MIETQGEYARRNLVEDRKRSGENTGMQRKFVDSA